MNVTFLDSTQLSEILDAAESLAVYEGPGASRTHAIKASEGRDVIIIVDGVTGDAMLVDECQYDDESGGSIHVKARAVFAGA